MNGRLGILAAILLLQLVLVAVFVLSDRSDDGSSTKLLDFDPSVVDRVVIADPTESVELERKDSKWQIGAVPVDAEKADKLVSDFANFSLTRASPRHGCGDPRLGATLLPRTSAYASRSRCGTLSTRTGRAPGPRRPMAE